MIDTPFLRMVWAEGEHLCLAIPQKFDDISYFQHRVFNSVEEAAKIAEQLDRSGKDIFFTVGTLKEAQVWDAKKLDKKTNTLGKYVTRTHENIASLRAFILDIDCGEGKPYTDKNAGVRAVHKLCIDAGLPKPTLVDSGGGVHVYFWLSEAIPADQWAAQANKFKEIVSYFGVFADPSRTSDRSSVLRVPGTHNYKIPNNPREVTIMKDGVVTPPEFYFNLFDKLIEEHNIRVLVPKVKNDYGLGSNVESRPPACSKSIYKRCAQMARVKEVGGPVGYQMRASACSIIKLCDEQDFSVLWANDADTARVIDQTEMMQNDSITDNPHLCSRFEENNPGGCDGCKLKGRGTSPIVLGRPMQEDQSYVTREELEVIQAKPSTQLSIAPNLYAQDEVTTVALKPAKDEKFRITHDGIALPLPPYPYKRNGEGHIYIEPKDADGALGDATLVYDGELYPYERVWDAFENCEMIKFRVMLPHDGWREAYVPLWQIVDLKSFSKIISTYGIMPGSNDRTQMLSSYMNAYIKQIQQVSKSTSNYPQLGWQKDASIFVLTDKSYNENGEVENCGVSSALKHSVASFRKRGTLEEWKSVVDVYARPGYEPYAFGHLVGYGSLLFQFSVYHGAIVNMVGDSGSGKSTVLQTINSLFGHPDEAMLTQSDTSNSRMNRIGVFNSICTTYDEITNIDPESLSQFCYAVTQGRDKHRLTQGSTEKANNTRWKMLLASTSNANLMSKLSGLKQDSSAESLRVFEFYINSQNVMEKQEAADIFKKLQDNYGHAGEIFVKYVVQNKDKVKELIRTIQISFDKLANVPNKERYWSEIVSCALAGGVIAKKLDLCSFDINTLMAWAISQIKHMRNIVDDHCKDGRALLVEFLNSAINNTIVVAGGTDKDKSMYVREEPRGQLWCRNEIDVGVMYVSKSEFRKWLTKGGSDFNWVKKTLRESGVLINDDKDKVLSSGSSVSKTGQTRCWMIDLNHADMAGISLTQVRTDMGQQINNVLEIKKGNI